MAIMVAAGTGARAGVLVKDADAFERLSKVTTLIVDKTGTLTLGKPRVASVEPLGGADRREVLRAVALAEIGSEHALARGIVDYAREEGVLERAGARDGAAPADRGDGDGAASPTPGAPAAARDGSTGSATGTAAGSVTGSAAANATGTAAGSATGGVAGGARGVARGGAAANATGTAAGSATTRAVRGKGVVATIEGERVVFGTPALLEAEDVAVSDDVLARSEELRQGGATVSLAAIGGRVAGIFAITDEVKPGAREAIAELQRRGVRVVMMTGDAKTSARAVARALDLHDADVFAHVMPEDKARMVEKLRAQGETVAMAGDGINDAPALAAADVGIAMGTGADVAIEAAPVTLVKGDLRGISRALVLGRATMKNVRQNLALAFLYNVLAIPIAAAGLLGPMIAAGAMSLSSVSVVGNALRLRRALDDAR
jgi:Cu+-exporting ATPase